MRVLMLGTTNSPHIQDLTVELSRRCIEVVVAGDAAPHLPRSRLSDSEVRVESAPLPPMGLRAVERVRWLRRLTRDVRPDVVHAHYLVEDPFYAVVAQVRPLVATAWGSDVLLARGVNKLRARTVARRADLVTA